MRPEIHRNPILGVYYYPHPDWSQDQIAHDLDAFVATGLRSIWLFYDPFFDVQNISSLHALLNHAHSVGLTIVPVLGQFLQLVEHPEVKIVNADSTTSDDPRYWNMGCFRHPLVLEIATQRTMGFFEECGEHPALYRIADKPVMSFVHEAYYRNSVPEFGGDVMQPNCYCDHCRKAWQDYLRDHDLDTGLEPPVDNRDPVVWQHWIDCHAAAIPEFLNRLIHTTKVNYPLWATHECNDFYPASWQSVYTGNDWWRMGAVLDFGHEDMYPLEFDTRYICYVYDYAKDILRSAMGFEGIITANGQAFQSWLGYQIPQNSMSEQVYSALAHGALGLVWWTWLRADTPDTRYHFIQQTKPFNTEYIALVEALEGYELAQARVALLYSWTTMSQELSDNHTYDALLTYMLLVQSGYPVDLLSEAQIAAGVLDERGYEALFVMGCAALPPTIHATLDAFVRSGGLVIADYAPYQNNAFPPAFENWRVSKPGKMKIYTLPNRSPVPVQLGAASLLPPEHAQILATFEDGTPAVCQIKHGNGTVILAGSYLGWDYANHPGYYDLGKMFPFHVRQDAALRQFITDQLKEHGITPPIVSSNSDVEVGLWHTPDHDNLIAFVINHLTTVSHTEVRLPVAAGEWQVADLLTGDLVLGSHNQGEINWQVTLDGLQGRALIVRRNS